MALAQIKPVSRKYVWAFLADLSTASSAFAAAPCKGTVVKVGTVIYNAITSADSLMTFEINNVASGFAWTVATAGSAAGDVDTAVTPTTRALAQVKENDTIEWVTSGGSNTTTPTMCWAEIEMD